MSNIEDFLNTAVGRAHDPDRAYGYQCVDLADAYAQAITGVPWQQSLKGVGGANEFAGFSNNYFDWIPGGIPRRGDMPVWGGDPANGNPWGHIAIVLNADRNGYTVVEQSGLTPRRPAYTARYGYGWTAVAGQLRGFIRPKTSINIQGNTPKEWDEMASKEEIKQAFRDVLNERLIDFGGGAKFSPLEIAKRTNLRVQDVQSKAEKLDDLHEDYALGIPGVRRDGDAANMIRRAANASDPVDRKKRKKNIAK